MQTTPTHHDHIYRFLNAPLHERAAWARLQIAEMEAELASGSSRSADEYYNLKDRLRSFQARLTRKSEIEVDPMGFWFGRQSN